MVICSNRPLPAPYRHGCRKCTASSICCKNSRLWAVHVCEARSNGIATGLKCPNDIFNHHPAWYSFFRTIRGIFYSLTTLGCGGVVFKEAFKNILLIPITTTESFGLVLQPIIMAVSRQCFANDDLRITSSRVRGPIQLWIY